MAEKRSRKKLTMEKKLNVLYVKRSLIPIIIVTIQKQYINKGKIKIVTCTRRTSKSYIHTKAIAN